jgi:hypothetical protein
MVDTIYLSQLQVGENSNFHHETLEVLENSDTEQLGVLEQVVEYKAAVVELDDTIDVFSASELAKASARIDEVRDRKYSAFKAFTKVMINDDDEAKTAAAERIIVVLRNSEQELGNPLTLGMVKESTALSSLVRNLEPLASDIQLIGAEDKLNNLKEANQSFIDLQFDRHIEKSTKHSGDTKAARSSVDTIYKNIIARINARILLHGEESFSTYVKAQNDVIAKHKALVAQRKGRKK